MGFTFVTLHVYYDITSIIFLSFTNLISGWQFKSKCTSRYSPIDITVYMSVCTMYSYVTDSTKPDKLENIVLCLQVEINIRY